MNELQISNHVQIPLAEIEMSAIRAQGAGGQNVNKVASSIHLRFDIANSSLPEQAKQRLLKRKDQRISKEGVIVIKAQQSRSQEQNRQTALQQLQQLIRSALIPRKTRRATKPTRAAKEKRLQQKTRRAQVKSLRRRVSE